MPRPSGRWKVAGAVIRDVLSLKDRRPNEPGQFEVPDPLVHHTDDRTKGCTIYGNFPIEVIDQVRFKHPVKNSLVKEFWYQPDGSDVRYDAPDEENDNTWKYAKLITKSSHYKEMGRTLVSVAIKVSSISAHLALALACRSKSYDGVDLRLRVAFVSIFLFKILLMIGFGVDRARKKIIHDPGDFVRQTTRWDYLERLIFTTFFNIFDVTADLTDLPSLMHVRKPAQPFAVFRSSDAIRAWVVGWLTRSQHEVEAQSGRMSSLVLSIICDIPLMFLKVQLGGGMKWSTPLVMAIFWSLLNFWLNAYTLRVLVRQRRIYYRSMKDEARRLQERRNEIQEKRNEIQPGGEVSDNLGEDPDEANKVLLTRLRIVYRNLTTHFGEIVPPEYRVPTAADQVANRSRTASTASEDSPSGAPSQPLVQAALVEQAHSAPSEPCEGQVIQRHTRRKSSIYKLQASVKFLLALQSVKDAKGRGETAEKEIREAQMEAIYHHDQEGAPIDPALMEEMCTSTFSGPTAQEARQAGIHLTCGHQSQLTALVGSS